MKKTKKDNHDAKNKMQAATQARKNTQMSLAIKP